MTPTNVSTPPTELIELGNRYESKRAAHMKIYEDSIDPQTKTSNLTREKLDDWMHGAEAKQIEADGILYTAKAAEWREKVAKEGGQVVPDMPGAPRGRKSIGERVFEAESIKDKGTANGFMNFNTKMGTVKLDNVEMKDLPRTGLDEMQRKTLMTDFGAAGYAPFIQRTGEVVYQPTGQIILQDFMPQDTTDQAAIKFMFESTYDNESNTRPEGGTYPESGLTYIEKTASIYSIATIIPVTEEQLEDVPQLQAIINNRMGVMVRQKVQDRLLNGSGSSDVQGFLTASGLLSQAATAGDSIVSIIDAITLVNSNSYTNAESAHCNALVVNPQDLLKIRTMKNNIGDYILGNPAQPLYNSQIWGVGLAETEKIAAGTMLVGDFAMLSHLWTRKGLTIEIGYSGTDFAQGKKSIRANTRIALQISRSNGFCKITGVS